ncbi:hypothetical protein AAG906_012751 [Vitis piasezkii]
MKIEYVALLTNSTWSLVPKPINKHIIGCKWIYKLKLKVDGSIDRFKAHLVAKGFNQTYEKEVYMVQLPGFINHSKPDFFYKLHKALYGLKQAPLCWQGSFLHLSQTKYMQNLLTHAGLADCKPITTPMTNSHTLSVSYGSLLGDPSQYRSIGATSFGLSFHSSFDLQLTIYADVDWVGCPDDQAKYKALANVVSKLQWIQHLLQELFISSFSPPILLYDNLSATFLTTNPIFHSRVKHVELDCHFVQEKVLNKTLVVQRIPSCDQIVDVLTKALPIQQFLNLRSKLTILAIPMSLRGC